MKIKLKLFSILGWLFAFSNVIAMEEDPGEVATQALGSIIVAGDVQGVANAIAQGANVKYLSEDTSARHLKRKCPFMSIAILNLSDAQALPILKLLLENHADVNQEDDVYGNSPLHFAAKKGHLACQRLLLAYGAQINKKNKSKMPPLHEALSHKKPCSVLLAAGCTLDRAGWFEPIHYAAQHGRLHFFKDLTTFVPTHEVLQEKRKKTLALLLCFKRFKDGDPFKLEIPKDMRRMLCQYAAKADVDTLVQVLVDKKIETLRKWFSRKDGTSIIEFFYGKENWIVNGDGDVEWEEEGYKTYYSQGKFLTIRSLTNLENLDQHRPTIRENIIKALHEVPLRPIKKAKREK